MNECYLREDSTRTRGGSHSASQATSREIGARKARRTCSLRNRHGRLGQRGLVPKCRARVAVAVANARPATALQRCSRNRHGGGEDTGQAARGELIKNGGDGNSIPMRTRARAAPIFSSIFPFFPFRIPRFPFRIPPPWPRFPASRRSLFCLFVRPVSSVAELRRAFTFSITRASLLPGGHSDLSCPFPFYPPPRALSLLPEYVPILPHLPPS